MTYKVDGLIEAIDYNNIANNLTPSINLVNSTGIGNSGYGQTPMGTIEISRKITAPEWITLLTAMTTIANHQGTLLESMVPLPTQFAKVLTFEKLIDNLSLLYKNRLNSVSSGTDITKTTVNSATWSDQLEFQFQIVFGSHDRARYFFNAGGQVGLNFSHPNNNLSINPLISDICFEIGTIWISSPTSGTASIANYPYSGVTKVGGVNSIRGTGNTNAGFYALTQSLVGIYTQHGDFAYHNYADNTNLSIQAAYNGSGTMTLKVIIDQVPDGVNVSGGTTAACIVRNPSNAYISNSWGNPFIN
jgi:hypothetical protein